MIQPPHNKPLGYDIYRIRSNQIIFVKSDVTIYTLSHWALTDCTVVTSSAIRHSNWVRKNLKTLDRENKTQRAITRTEYNDMLKTIYLECIKHP